MNQTEDSALQGKVVYFELCDKTLSPFSFL